MEHNIDNLLNLSDLPPEIQQHIAAYLDASSLGFFAQSHKSALKNVLPVLLKYQARFPLGLITDLNTYFYQGNQLFVSGYNKECKLGLKNRKDYSNFSAVTWSEERGRICQITAGRSYIVMLTEDNRLWVCGSNHTGQLGLGDHVLVDNSNNVPNCPDFTSVPWPEEQGRIQRVIAGIQHTFVLTDDNSLWACGYNGDGRLGLGDMSDRSAFKPVSWPKEQGNIEQIVAGDHTVVLTDDNRLWVCGDNRWGQLGLNDNEHRFTFTVVPWQTEQGEIKKIIVGRHHTVILTENNQLWTCGHNYEGQLGLGDTKPRSNFTAVPWPKERGKIKQINAGESYTVVLTENNKLWVCGANYSGGLGLGDEENRKSFTLVPWPKKQGKIEQIVTGPIHILVLTENNKLWVCGNNRDGQLGLGDNKHRATFTPVNALPKAIQQILTFNNTLKKLINMGILLTQTPGTKKSKTRHAQHQVDEPEGQPPLKKMRL